jgi:acetylornithine/succinyldiaminopimelate/putrescine aminotransferase
VIDFAAGIAVLNTGHRHPKSLPPLNSSCRPLHGLSDCPVRKLCHAGRAD